MIFFLVTVVVLCRLAVRGVLKHCASAHQVSKLIINFDSNCLFENRILHFR